MLRLYSTCSQNNTTAVDSQAQNSGRGAVSNQGMVTIGSRYLCLGIQWYHGGCRGIWASIPGPSSLFLGIYGQPSYDRARFRTERSSSRHQLAARAHGWALGGRD